MKAVIAKHDIATAYGWGLDALWNGLAGGTTAVTATNRFADRGFVSDQAAFIPDLTAEAGESRLLAALRRILEPVKGKLDPATPLIVATTVGEIEHLERGVLEGDCAAVASARPTVLVRKLQEILGLRGPAMTINSACASSSAAITQAAAMVLGGEAKEIIVVTGDCVSEFVYSGFSTLMSLSSQPARPFDAERAGLTLGEAVGFAVIRSEEDSAAEEIAILGWGNTTDAVHMTAPDRDARGLSWAIAKALAMAQVPPGQIGFVAAHGTGTLYSDAMEMKAFARALGLPRPVFSTKGALGHTLSAAGLVQILVSARAIGRGIVPPSVGCETPDELARGWVRNSNTDLGAARLGLSTNSGFGGVNTAIVVGGKGLP
jgi:3-oxoacyl-[acyl-carrier-protein] synthase II